MTINSSNCYDISRNNWSDPNLFPSELYLDTNVAVDLIARRNNSYEIERFLKEFSINKGNTLFWSTHTENELLDCLHVDTYQSNASKYGYKRNEWKKMENEISNSDSAKLAQEALNRYQSGLTVLNQFGSLLSDEPDNLPKKVTTIYTTYGGNRKDAEHIAFANSYEINNILTNDSGFLRFPDQNIFGLSKTIKENYLQGKTRNKFIDLLDQ